MGAVAGEVHGQPQGFLISVKKLVYILWTINNKSVYKTKQNKKKKREFEMDGDLFRRNLAAR